MRDIRKLGGVLLAGVALSHFAAGGGAAPRPQAQNREPAEKQGETGTPTQKVQEPARFELLESRYRFEENGNSRKEVHALVRINTELGVRQFARLHFDYNRLFEELDIPLVHMTHSDGGTVDILPRAIADNPNPAVESYPAYQDVRVKSVRILGLRPGDLLEYRVVTSTTGPPLAPDFWLDHSFDRTGIVSKELFEIDLPAASQARLQVAPAFGREGLQSEDRHGQRVVYRWNYAPPGGSSSDSQPAPAEPDLVLTSFKSWFELSRSLGRVLLPPASPSVPVAKLASELTLSKTTPEQKIEAIYNFVSQKFSTVDLPLGSTGFRVRPAEQILNENYATAEDKLNLFGSLCRSVGVGSIGALAGSPTATESRYPRPTPFTRLLAAASFDQTLYWLDPAIEVAPFRVIPSNLRGGKLLTFNPSLEPGAGEVRLTPWVPGPGEPPYPGRQLVHVEATLDQDGKLIAKVHYSLRGDNELVLRLAFHQTPREKWKQIAHLLSLGDGFRGEIASVEASDPFATDDPFTVDYEISMPKFVDWSKRPVQLPALLPQIAMPDPPSRALAGAPPLPIELGTPLEVSTTMTLRLPPEVSVEPPTGSAVRRDYATYSSHYSQKGQAVTASREIHFLLKEIPAEQSQDYNAFLHAVQNDQVQEFRLDKRTAVRTPTVPPGP